MDIDPECNYCPTCHDEYRPEITTCAACGVALESGAALRARLDRQRIGRPAPIGPDEPLALVRHKIFMRLAEYARACARLTGTIDIVRRMRQSPPNED